MKMHMVSIWYRYRRYTFFVNLPIGETPKVTPAMLAEIGIQPGQCFGTG